MMRRTLTLPCLLGLLGLLGFSAVTPPALGQGLGRTSFADRATGLRLFLPTRWVAQSRSSLPGLVAAFRHPLGARLLISAQTRKDGDTPRSLADTLTTHLKRRGWTVLIPTIHNLGPAEGVIVEASDAAGKTKVFQVYAMHDKHALVITLSVPAPHAARLLGDLRFITKTARFGR